jgi:hypothetical protein
MLTKDLLKQLAGIQTVKSVGSILGVGRQQAIYYVHRLRKQGYVKTKKLPNNLRVYDISFENSLGVSYYDSINKYSPVKVLPPADYKVHGKAPNVEEALVYAIRTKSIRTILAALALFRKVTDWKELYRLAKKNKIARQVGALYDLARSVFRVRRMPMRFRNNALPKKGSSKEFLVPGLKSRDFAGIERTWGVFLPFNRADLEEYA